MNGLGEYVKPEPDDPRNLSARLAAGGAPINRGIAMLLNAPSLVAGYSCQSCGHQKEFAQPLRMDREDVRRSCCGACGSDRISLNLRSAI